MQETFKYWKTSRGYWNTTPQWNKAFQLLVYYLFLAGMTIIGISYGYYFSEEFFATSKNHSFERFMNGLKLFWLVPIPYALLNFYSFVRYPVVGRAKIDPPRRQNVFNGRLHFRYITRGLNPTLVAENVEIACRLLSQSLPNDSWRIDVVTDTPLGLDWRNGLVDEIVVPESYATPNGTLFKARALQYALSFSRARLQDWIIHLDEETQFDKETVWSIYNYIVQESHLVATGQQKYPKIGQGVILYGSRVVVNWLTTLADSIRVGDDYGRFRLQYKHGKAYFGIHGSYIVANNEVEQLVGLDHGPKASITEDAFFALMAQSMGIEFGFVDGYMYEKSPFSLKDFVKQRHRWFGGLWYCALDRNIPWRERVIMFAFMIMWSLSWLCIGMIYVNFFYPTGTPVWLAIAGGISFSYFVCLYMVGYIKTFYGKYGKLRFVGGLLAQILLIPVFFFDGGNGRILRHPLPTKRLLHCPKRDELILVD